MAIITQFHIPQESFSFACKICEQSDPSIAYDMVRYFGQVAQKLIEINAFNTGRNSIIEDINDNEAEIIYQNNKPLYFDKENQKWVELNHEEICQYSLKFSWILSAIAKDLNINDYMAEEIIPDHLWKMGAIKLGVKIPIFFARRIYYNHIFEKIYKALEKQPNNSPAIILTTSPPLPFGFQFLKNYQIISLSDCLTANNKNFHLDLNIIKTATRQTIKSGFSSGYRGAYFNDIHYSFSKKQAAIIETLDKHGGKVNKHELLAEADSQQCDVHRIFKRGNIKHPAWNNLIKFDNQGNYWLERDLV